MAFRDRTDAGLQLGAALAGRVLRRPLVIALPRGGVPIGAQVASALDAPFDVLVVRKIGHPRHREFGLGAIAEGDVELIDRNALAQAGLERADLAPVLDAERRELARRVARYRPGRGPVPVSDRTVVLVDDGLATGWTARAAIESLRRAGASQVILAVPVGAPDVVAQLREIADDVVCLEQPVPFRAVGAWYRTFSQVGDDEVLALLAAASADRPAATADPGRPR